MASVVVCAEPSSLQQAGRFAAKLLGDADLRSFEELRREIPIQPMPFPALKCHVRHRCREAEP